MPAPTNISFATATDVGTLSRDTVTTILQQVDDAGTTYTVWYRYTAVAGDTEIMAFPWGGGGSYTPDVTFWLDASTQYLFNDAQNRPSQIPVTPGVTYGIKIHPNGGNPAPANLTLKLQLGPDDQLSAGQLAINDSTAGYPAVVMNPTTGEPISFHTFSAGEGVQVLTSGIVCAADIAISGVKLYSPDLSVLATPTMPATGYTTAIGSNQVDTFWALKGGGLSNSTAVSISSAGVVGTPLDLGATSFVDVQPQRDNSALYGIRGTQIRKVTNPGGVVTTFLTVDATFSFGANLLMMTDDTLLVPYEKAATTSYIKRFNLSAVQQGSTITLTGVVNALERIFADPDDPNYFWIWWQTSTTNRFQRYKVSDGSLSNDLTWPKFVEGDYQGAASATPDAFFGADFSCVPWILRGTTSTETFTIRRQRRWLLPSSDDNKQMQIPVIEIVGRGNGLLPGPAADPPVQGSAPILMWRLSKDGGKTWLPERAIPAGLMGEYRARWLIQRATGIYRNAVGEVTVSDPVDWQLLFATAPRGITEGSS